MTLTFGSLFAGIGGFDLGFERAGMECKWQVEIDDYCNKVLAKHWPDVRRYKDVKECGKHNLEPVDVICGGFPCQPHSVAGKRRGADDDRNLWPEFLRIVREVRPTWVVAENVPGIVSLYLDTVLSDLEGEAYSCWTFNIPACAFDAPHRRERIFVVANAPLRQDNQRELGHLAQAPASRQGGNTAAGYGGADVSDTFSNRLQGSRADGQVEGQIGLRSRERGDQEQRFLANPNQERQSRLPKREKAQDASTSIGGQDVPHPQFNGLEKQGNGRIQGRQTDTASDAGWWTVEPNVGRVAHGVPARVDRLRALGNAVVQQVAEWIGRRIVECAE